MKPNLKQIQRVQSKERILNVATRLFKKNGFTATGIDQVMAEAGLTAGGFYAHFSSKTDLLEQVIEHSFKHSLQLLIKDTEHLNGDEKVKAMIKRYISPEHRDLPEKGCIIPALAAEIYRGTAQSDRMISHFLNKWSELFAQHLPPTWSPSEKKMRSLKLVSQAVGAVLLSRMVRNSDLSEDILNAARS